MSVLAHTGVGRSAEYVTAYGKPPPPTPPPPLPSAMSSRWLRYGHTLHSTDPDASTRSMARHDGQKGHFDVDDDDDDDGEEEDMMVAGTTDETDGCFVR